MDSSGLKRFGSIIYRRRSALGLTQLDVRRNGGPSPKTLTQLEAGRQSAISAGTLARLDRALRWRPGSAAVTLDGGDPDPVDEEPPTPEDWRRHQALAAQFERIGLRGLAARGTVRGDDGRTTFTPQAIDALIRKLAELPDQPR